MRQHKRDVRAGFRSYPEGKRVLTRNKSMRLVVYEMPCELLLRDQIGIRRGLWNVCIKRREMVRVIAPTGGPKKQRAPARGLSPFILAPYSATDKPGTLRLSRSRSQSSLIRRLRGRHQSHLPEHQDSQVSLRGAKYCTHKRHGESA